MARFSPHFSSCGRKSAARKIEIGEREEHEYLRAVLGDAAIADAAIAELAFDDAEHVFNLRAYFAVAAVSSALPLRKIAARLRLLLHRPLDARVFRRALLLITRVALVA